MSTGATHAWCGSCPIPSVCAARTGASIAVACGWIVAVVGVLSKHAAVGMIAIAMVIVTTAVAAAGVRVRTGTAVSRSAAPAKAIVTPSAAWIWAVAAGRL